MSDELLRALRDGGTLEREGRFEVDAAKAREKLAQFQLEDPHLYVLEFVQAAHLLGASKILVTQDADELEVRFDGQVLEAEHLRGLWSMAMSRHQDPRLRALRHLAIGINASEGLRPAVLIVESGAGDAVQRLVMRAGQPEVVEQVSAPEGWLGTRVYVREAWRPGHMVEFWRGVRGALEETQHVRRRCVRSEAHIEVGGQRVSVGKKPPDPARDHLWFKLGGDEGCVWLNERAGDQRAALSQHGVDVAIRENPLPGLPFGWGVMVEGPRLSKDLSQSDFVRDEAWKTLMVHGLADALCALFGRWAQGAGRGADGDEVCRAMLLWLIRDHASPETFEALELRIPGADGALVESRALVGGRAWELYEALCDRSMWACDEEGVAATFSARELWAQDPKCIEWADAAHLHTPKRGVVARGELNQLQLLALHKMRRVEDVGAAYEAAAARAVHVERWSKQPVLEGIQQGECWAVSDFAGRGARAWLGFRLDGEQARVVWRCQGRAVSVERQPAAPRGLMIVIDSAGELDERGTHVAWSDGLASACAQAVRHVPQAFEATWREVSSRGAVTRQLAMVGELFLDGADRVSPEALWEQLFGAHEPPASLLAAGSRWEALMEARQRLREATKGVDFAKRVSALGVLAQVPVLCGLDDEVMPRWSLTDVARMVAEHGKLVTLGEEEVKRAQQMMETLGSSREVVVVRDATQRRILQATVDRALCGLWMPELERYHTRHVYMERPVVESGLPPTPSWGEGRGWVARKMLSGAVEGELGMGPAQEPWGLLCHVLYAQRELVTLMLPLPWGRLEAVVRVADTTAQSEWDERSAAKLLRPALEAALEPAARGLVRSWLGGLREPATRAELEAQELLWQLASEHVQCAAWAEDAELVRLLASTPFIASLGGELWTLPELHALLAKQDGPLCYVLGDAGVMASLVGDDAQLVLRLVSSSLVPLVQRAVGPARRLRDVSDSEARHRELEQLRLAFMGRIPDGLLIKSALFRHPMARGRWRGQVALMPDANPRDGEGFVRVEVLYEQRIVATTRCAMPLGCFYVRIDVPELRMDAEWSGLAAGYDLSGVLLYAQQSCWAALIAAADGATTADAQLREQLRWYLVRALQTTLPEEVREALQLMRAFARDGAPPTSYDQLRASKKPVRYIKAGATQAQGAVVAESASVIALLVTLFPDAEQVKLARRAPAPPAPAPTLSTPPAAQIPASPAPPAPPAPTAPEVALRERVKAMLLLARGEDRVLLGDMWASGVVCAARGAAAPLCVIVGGSAQLNVDHPSCALAMRRAHASALAVVVAGVYGAINRHEEIITDRHERLYLARLAEVVAAELGVA
jgi:hypothetical protein